MRLPFVRAAWLAAGLSLTACSSLPPATVTLPSSTQPNPLLLISIDGLRADALGQGYTPNLDRLAAQGVHAQWMNPAYPSLTFPNHYTLVTGLRPDRHGMVHNTMREEGLGDFRVADTAAGADGRWWQAEPIWVSVENAGLPSASWAWPGSAAEIGGRRPSRWHAYDESVPLQARADAVATWLNAGAASPRFTAVYLETVDSAGHAHGPHSAQAHDAIRQADAAIGRLTDALAKAGNLDTINLIIVSDHGMAPVAPGHVVTIEDMVPMRDAAVISVGQSIGISPRPGRQQAAERRLLGRHDHYQCWRKQELPAHWHYGSNPRIPPIVCQMDEGWEALPAATAAQRPAGAARGSHGYDPALPSMRATFIARGPAFRQGVRIAAFDNVDLHPLMLHLLGLPARATDGRLAPLLPALKAEARPGH